MMGLLRDITVVAITAFKDTAKNIFRPAHNLRVILGKEREASLSQKISVALAVSRLASNQLPASSAFP
jgi:hypothetical protein